MNVVEIAEAELLDFEGGVVHSELGVRVEGQAELVGVEVGVGAGY